MAEEKNMQPEWDGVENVLVIMAHPDDPDFTAAGTVIQMADQGINVTYMILTNGDKGNHNPDITREELIEFRKREQRAAAEVEEQDVARVFGAQDAAVEGRLGQAAGWLDLQEGEQHASRVVAIAAG